MVALPTGELERLRADMEAAVLPDTCNVLSVTRVSNGEGGYTETWGTATANVACRLDSLTSRGVGFIGSEQVVAGALKPYTTWILTVPHDTAMTTANRIEIGSDTFNVIEADAPKSWAATRRATLEKI